MAGEIQLNSTTMATESSGTITLSNVNSATNRTNLGLGSIATQAADSVSISGGNITGGTIGSGVTFPAGHVIQTVRSTKSGNSNGTTSTTFAKVQNSSSEYYYATINNVLENSKVLIKTIFSGRYDKTANNAGGSFGLYRESTIILGESTLSLPSPYYEHINVTGTDYYHPQFIMFLDESPATGTNNYYLGYSSYGSTSVQLVGHTPTFEMILMEIA